MNSVQCLINRQMGIYCRLNYDSVLQRLLVNSEESFYGYPGSDAVTSLKHDPPICACRFAEVSGYDNILALANEDGRVAIQDTSSVNSASSIEGIPHHNNAVFDLVWMPGHMYFNTVSGDHTACLWDVGSGASRAAAVFAGQTRSVKTVAFSPTAGALASPGRDGHVLVWDPRFTGLKPDNKLSSYHAAAASPSASGKRARLHTPRAVFITELVFQDGFTLISCVECDGNIKIWDLHKNYSAYTGEPLPKHSIPYCGSSAKNGCTNLIADAERVLFRAIVSTWRRRGDVLLVTAGYDDRHKLWRVGANIDLPLREEYYRGRAELVPQEELSRLPPWGALDRTSRSLKRSAATRPTSGGKRIRTALAGGTSHSSKRSLVKHMSGAGNASTSRDVSDTEIPIKRIRLDTDPAEPTTDPSLLPAGSKRPHTSDLAPSNWELLPSLHTGTSFLSLLSYLYNLYILGGIHAAYYHLNDLVSRLKSARQKNKLIIHR